MSCTHVGELLAGEGPFLEIEIQKHRVLLENRLEGSVSRKEAQLDYLAKLGESYFTGFKDCYCAYVCPERETCDIFRDRKNNV